MNEKIFRKECEEVTNLWKKIGNKCLTYADNLLSAEVIPTVTTARTVRELVETAISIDKFNLLRTKQNRSGSTNELARTLLPEPRQSTLEQASIRPYRLERDFVQRYRTDELINIAKSGVIDNSEELRFDAIMNELKEIVAAALALQMGDFREE